MLLYWFHVIYNMFFLFDKTKVAIKTAPLYRNLLYTPVTLVLFNKQVAHFVLQV